MKDLMQLIESKQFMAHANSILEAESNTTTNAGDKVKAFLIWKLIWIIIVKIQQKFGKKNEFLYSCPNRIHTT